MAGTLFVVATPIGNLEDMSLRALRTLREVDVIAAEDTRRTAKLLATTRSASPMVSLHEHNEHREAPRLVARNERRAVHRARHGRGHAGHLGPRGTSRSPGS